MGKMEWRVSRSQKNSNALVVEMLEDRKALGHTTMTAIEIDGLIKHLARFRAQLSPEVPRKVPKDQLSGVENPYMAVWDIPVLPSGKILAIRHHGLGWLSFALPQDVADGLAGGLLSHTISSPFLNIGGRAN